jgi:predicted thioredoxin/glutaredoxin
MDELLNRFVPDLVGRLHGPFAFRFILQPLMAGLAALHDGLADARDGKPPYFWSILTKPLARRALLREGWHRVARVIVLGVVMDVLYQLIEFRTIHPVQLVVIVLTLAFVPYLLLRGPIGRIARRHRTSAKIHAWDPHAARREH